MDKRRLTTLLDVAFVMAMLLILWENLPIPTTPRNPAAFWGRRREIFRALASVLWLLALWTGMYPSWDCAGRVSHHTVYLTAGQALGQKNTVFAIWMGYTFMDPVTSVAGGFYSIWHNCFNTWQLYRRRKELEAAAGQPRR